MLNQTFKAVVRLITQRAGLDIRRHANNVGASANPFDFSETSFAICDLGKPYTMTSPARVKALIDAARYVVTNRVDGALDVPILFDAAGRWRLGGPLACPNLFSNERAYLLEPASAICV